jgi:uncharacterized damage-inducible protein DinB
MRTVVMLCALAAPRLLPAQNLKTVVIQRYFNGVSRNLEGAAEAMPAEKFGYKPAAGEMTFAEWLNHSTERNYQDCAALKGEAQPEAAKKVPELKSKAEVSQALKDSLAYCSAALEGVDEAKVLASPQLTYSLLHTVVHNNEIYGNLAVYLRTSGIVPPSTARMVQRKK